ncbi:hypothetical protein L3X65_17525 [Vibrio diabolicus]|uniref:hypothetical protein n=1 Tax=Vibrio diabolicus TaxID=50719 RepID=UPI00211AEB50|nr:hypothetical protein [Vibrio diabolicus]MCG9230948.1 hypothetical protein [Vibrio diabolicus]MCG9574447.1 hypothetical protein [Vibrio diabolicus]MCG9593461.1 hypothetical protein [Vibrio diabolicus]
MQSPNHHRLQEKKKLQLRYDSLDHFKTPEELIFRLRLWTDPELRKAPILMASQATGWNGISVVNASEQIYGYFISQDILSTIKSEDHDVIKNITKFDLMGVLTKLQQNISNGMFNAGGMHDELSSLMWLGPKVGPCLNEAKTHIINYYNETEQLSEAFENLLFVEHYPSQPGGIQDWFKKEKFFVISYKEGERDQQCIVMSHAAMLREYGIENI